MKKVKMILLIMAFVFSFSFLAACDKADDTNADNDKNQEVIDVNGVTLKDAEKTYTGEPLAISVENLPSGTAVSYSYTLDGAEVKEMVEIGLYEVTATIKNKSTGDVLKTLKAKLNIKDVEKYDEILEDELANLELMFGTNIFTMMPNPDNAKELIAGGVELWASESLYFRHAGYEEPLNFLSLAEESVGSSKVKKNTIFIAEPGTYDVVMSFPEGSIVPLILVRQGSSNSEIYFRQEAEEFAMDKENGTNLFTVDAEANTATYEVALEANDVFKISNYYSSLLLNYDPYFAGLPMFAAVSTTGDYNYDAVKVAQSGTYKFVVDLSTRGLSVFKDNVKVEKDYNLLYFRSSINGFGLTHPFISDGNVSYFEIELEPGHTFKFADSTWGTQYNITGYKSTVTNGVEFTGGADDNYSVVIPGLYRFELDATGVVTVYRDGNKVGEAKSNLLYQLVINGDVNNPINLVYKGKQDVDRVEHDEYFALGVQLNVGDVITLRSYLTGDTWAVKILNPYTNKDLEKFTASDAGITCKIAGKYDVYVQFAYEQDKIYLESAQ